MNRVQVNSYISQNSIILFCIYFIKNSTKRFVKVDILRNNILLNIFTEFYQYIRVYIYCSHYQYPGFCIKLEESTISL